MPEDLWFGLGLADGYAVVEGGGGVHTATPVGPEPAIARMPSGLLSLGGFYEDLPHAAICWPPLSLVLLDSETATMYPHANFGSWLLDDPLEARDVPLLVRAVRRKVDTNTTTAWSLEWNVCAA